MRENRIRSIWKAGGAVVNGWLAIPRGFSAETMAHQGWDSLTIDMHHGVMDYQAAVNMLTTISTTNTVPVVRVPWNEPGILMKMLDAGAYGLICPMVNSADDAERLVAATHYPPRGTRSMGPIRATLYAGADYQKHANDTIVVFAMIETRQALDNLDAILSVHIVPMSFGRMTYIRRNQLENERIMLGALIFFLLIVGSNLDVRHRTRHGKRPRLHLDERYTQIPQQATGGIHQQIHGRTAKKGGRA